MVMGKLLAAVGIGGAKVETLLDNAATPLGGTITGRMRIIGGSVGQQISEVAVEIVTMVEREVDDERVKEARIIAKARIADGFTLNAGETRDLDLRVPVPLFTPVSLGRQQSPAWLRTRLDIPLAIDPTDDDALVIQPAPVQVDAFRAITSLGFRLRKSDVEHRPRWQGGHGFVQEFEFRQSGGRRRFDEVEMVFQPDGRGGFDLLVQVDRAATSLAGMLAEATGTDESWHRLSLPGGLAGPGEHAIADALRRILV